jgi:dTDP-4-dehydrorhamnose reductase
MKSDITDKLKKVPLCCYGERIMLMEVAGTNIWQKAVIFRTSLKDNKMIVYFNSISKELSMAYQI